MLVSKKHKKVILNLRDPDRVLNFIPTAKTVQLNGKTYIAVPHKFEETKLLRNLGFDVPDPILTRYNWPGRYSPLEAQRTTAAMLTMEARAYCLNGLGSGKSLASLWSYDFLRSEKLARKALIIAPLSTLERTWADHIFEHFPHLRYSVVHGSNKALRKKQLARHADVYIINHDGVKVLLAELQARDDIDCIIVDELAQVARNASTDRWKSLNILVTGRKWVWGLTGGPTPNEPTDAWAQCRLITPWTVPKYFSHFRDKTMRQLTNYKWEAREDALETVYQAMQPAVRFSREDCVDLPPVTFETREIDLTPDQKRAWKSMWDQLHAEYQGGAITAVNEAVKLSKLTQIVSGAAIGEDGNAVILNPSTRLAELDNLLDEAPAKIIVFCPFRAPLGVIQRHLAKRTSVEVIHGGVSKTQRDQIFGAFQSQANPRVLVAQPAAMSHGLTLTAASVIVWYAPITSAETYDQANARISRPGQTRNQLIVHIQSTPLEAKMYRKLQDKISLQGTLLEMFRSQTARSAA